MHTWVVLLRPEELNQWIIQYISKTKCLTVAEQVQKTQRLLNIMPSRAQPDAAVARTWHLTQFEKEKRMSSLCTTAFHNMSVLPVIWVTQESKQNQQLSTQSSSSESEVENKTGTMQLGRCTFRRWIHILRTCVQEMQNTDYQKHCHELCNNQCKTGGVFYSCINFVSLCVLLHNPVLCNSTHSMQPCPIPVSYSS